MKLPVIDIDKLKTFYIAAQTGKFSLTAEKVDLDHSVVSRQMQILEKDLNATLFHRNGRQGLTLTEKGEALLIIARGLFSQIGQIEPTLSAIDENLSGPLRIWVHNGYALNFLQSCLVEFNKKYPLIHFDIIASYDFKDVIVREADIAIGIALENLEDSTNLIQKKLFQYTFKLYATKDYVKKYGFPRNIQDLKNHKLISSSSPVGKSFTKRNWYLNLEKGKPLKPYFSSESNSLITTYVEAGLGIGSICPHMCKIESTNLVEILPEVSGPTVSLVISYDKHLEKSQKVKAFYNFLVEKSKLFQQQDPNLP